MTYKEALKKAKVKKSNIDFCIEYEKGYVFGNDSKKVTMGGYGNSRCVVLKDSGKVVPMNVFAASGTGKELKTFDV